MGSLKCKRDDRFSSYWKTEDWRAVLNALGDRMGNARNVGDDAELIKIEYSPGVYIKTDINCVRYKYKNHRINGNSKEPTNTQLKTIEGAAYDKIPRYKDIMLGGTLSTHTCEKCHGRGEVRCSSCNGTGYCKHCNHGYLSSGAKCPYCLTNHPGWCSSCKGSGRVPCYSCGTTGEYQTYKTMYVSDTTIPFVYYSYEALNVMINKQKLQTLVVYDGRCLKMHSLNILEYNDVDKVSERIADYVGQDTASDFIKELDNVLGDINDTKGTAINDITIRADVATLVIITYRYHKKEYILVLSKDTPAIYCYSNFPGRFIQRLRGLFGSNKGDIERDDSKKEGNYQK